ncbi:hypothetical protein [Nitratiruptor sp. SB155-2]|uniref:hypothetical protein n=1 Tax=Nitratiruptor sp. (strain SB155-2) TaxID=387092 RepID=UPI0003098A1D|nr:hypothetical protein [Nitratiruptor sp. SB155-2]
MKNKIESLRKKLIELEALMGSFSMKLLLQRILFELGREDIEIPDSIQNFPLDAFSQKELDQFIQLLATTVSSILGEDFEKEIKKTWNE